MITEVHTQTTILLMNGKTLINVVGPTASGKTGLAIALARHFHAHIISTDSRQVFKGIPIGTAQPTEEELLQAPHHLIAFRELSEDFNCGEYERVALSKLNELFEQNDIVISCGGSGLYIRALCEGIDNFPEDDGSTREKLLNILREDGLEKLQQMLLELDPQYYRQVDLNNSKRVVRALEVCLISGQKYSELRKGEKKERNFNIISVGIDYPREELYERINRRVDLMIENGLEEEVRKVLPLRNYNSLHTVGYSEFFEYFDGKISYEECIGKIKQNTRHYAKRQMTWFRRDKSIRWFAPKQTDSVIEYIESRISK